MKKVLAVLVILVSLQLQADGRRFMLEVKTGSGNSGTYADPKTGLDPSTVAATNNDEVNNNVGSISTDDVNNSYGSYGNPSGSSSETHHFYTNDCQPKKPC
ncbi:hypothetical protein JRO89_XS03G0318200 [Xanthoceras sorbifolium]|uniref:Uncharacterized protein n=1 Tax=Xanthoceras sorbifolium TaxID=99658 RepID=A0ABQ8ID49_9ROSI|nr:hypothetical protein JRO89_XS03G0318200 [Xanthoceras sorbifolium]